MALLRFRLLQDSVRKYREFRKDLGVPEKERVEALYNTSGIAANKSQEDFIASHAKLSSLQKADAPNPNNPKYIWREDDGIAILYERTIDVPAERDRLTRDIAKYEKGLASAERQLGNEGFLAKAPEHVVEGLKKQEAETRLLLEKARAALNALPKD